MQIKSTMRYRLTPVRMAIIKKTNKDMQKRESCTLLVALQIGVATIENSMLVAQEF